MLKPKQEGPGMVKKMKRETRNQRIVRLFKEGHTIRELAIRYYGVLPQFSVTQIGAREKIEAIIRKAVE